MAIIRTAVAPVNSAFSSSRSVALFESKMLQNTTIYINLHHYTLSKTKTQVFTLSEVLACVSVHCANQRQHSIADFLFKYFVNTLRTRVDVANEYLQMYNTGADVKNHLFL